MDQCLLVGRPPDDEDPTQTCPDQGHRRPPWQPAELVARIEAYDAWLATSSGTPKLLLTFTGSPTLLIGDAMTEWCASHIAELEISSCGEAGHHATEDRPDEIAAAISAWTDRHGLR